MSDWADMLAAERNGHRCMGYRCECGVTYSAKRPTADHIQHIIEVTEVRSTEGSGEHGPRLLHASTAGYVVAIDGDDGIGVLPQVHPDMEAARQAAAFWDAAPTAVYALMPLSAFEDRP